MIEEQQQEQLDKQKKFYKKIEKVCFLTDEHEDGYLEDKDFSARDILNDLILNHTASEDIKKEFEIISQKIKEANLLAHDLLQKLLSYD